MEQAGNPYVLSRSVKMTVDEYPEGQPPAKAGIGDGWDLKSISGLETIAKANLLVEYNGTYYTWAQATSNDNEEGTPLILHFIYGWNYGLQNYETVEEMSPFKGYWFFLYFYPIIIHAPDEGGTGVKCIKIISSGIEII